jgi:glycosyltransferase involved in cell wall biosynthesis
MNILLFSQSFSPNIGGVENHLNGLIPELQKAGHKITVITNNNKGYKNFETIDGIKIHRINYPEIKFLGLLKIWFEIFKKINLIKKADVIQIHDVFIYFLPFKLLFPQKKIITIFHGWETQFPIPRKNILYKQLAQKLSTDTISIGEYINKHYQLDPYKNQLNYGAVNFPKKLDLKKKEKNSFLFLGRLEEDTGLKTFLKTLDLIKKDKEIKITFCGDGSLRRECEKYGTVKGFINPQKELEKAEFCFVGGYLSMLEAFAYNCHVITSYQNQLKKDYWMDSIFSEYLIIDKNPKKLSEKIIETSKNKKENQKKINEARDLAKEHNFEKLAKLYLRISQ